MCMMCLLSLHDNLMMKSEHLVITAFALTLNLTVSAQQCDVDDAVICVANFEALVLCMYICMHACILMYVYTYCIS